MPEQHRPTLAGEGGFGLVEMLIAMAVMGIAFVGLLGGMATTTASASLHRTQAVAEIELRRYAEIIDAAAWDAGGNYAIPPGVPTAEAQAAPYGLSAYREPTTCAPVACGGAGVRTQVVTIGVKTGSGSVDEKIQIVKRAN